MTRRVAIRASGSSPPGHGREAPGGSGAGRSGAGPITRFDPVQSPREVRVRGQGFRSRRVLDKKEVRRFHLFAQCRDRPAEQAVTDACLASNWANGCEARRRHHRTGRAGCRRSRKTPRALSRKDRAGCRRSSVPMYMPNVAPRSSRTLRAKDPLLHGVCWRSSPRVATR